jgi:hypothetical protein
MTNKFIIDKDKEKEFDELVKHIGTTVCDFFRTNLNDKIYKGNARNIYMFLEAVQNMSERNKKMLDNNLSDDFKISTKCFINEMLNESVVVAIQKTKNNLKEEE